MKRRHFIQNSAALLSLAGAPFTGNHTQRLSAKKIRVSAAIATVEKEPLIRPFGFKGGNLTELWQAVVKLKSDDHTGIGLGTQSVLWSDAEIFASFGENKGNEFMFRITEKALEMMKGRTFTDPVSMIDSLVDELHEYGKKITGKPGLRKTFVLNALVAVDNALWLLYARENRISSFDDMIPPEYRAGLQTKHEKLAFIPLISYNVPVDDIKNDISRNGAFFIKIKLGQPGTQEEMLEKDLRHFSRIHEAIGNFQTPYTASGKIMYYFDANGRYESAGAVQEFVAHARQIGAFDQIAVFEEPFPEDNNTDVSRFGVRISADESAHTDTDVDERISRGYTAIALKPIAKTLSMTLKMIKRAHEKGVACFCADLTVNPVLVEWNRNIAARLSPLPGLRTGLLETNGEQNYRNWKTMSVNGPAHRAPWTDIRQGVFDTGREFYRQSGGIFAKLPHYENLFTSHQTK